MTLIERMLTPTEREVTTSEGYLCLREGTQIAPTKEDPNTFRLRKYRWDVWRGRETDTSPVPAEILSPGMWPIPHMDLEVEEAWQETRNPDQLVPRVRPDGSPDRTPSEYRRFVREHPFDLVTFPIGYRGADIPWVDVEGYVLTVGHTRPRNWYNGKEPYSYNPMATETWGHIVVIQPESLSATAELFARLSVERPDLYQRHGDQVKWTEVLSSTPNAFGTISLYPFDRTITAEVRKLSLDWTAEDLKAKKLTVHFEWTGPATFPIPV